ncbi:MAG: chemotaxis protein CheW [Alphaproteobacteria bacterium]
MLVVPFEVASHLFALPLDRIIRVEAMVELQALPQPLAHVAGAVIHDGRALPVYDLRSKLGLEPRAMLATDRLVLSRARGGAVAVAAESASAVIEVEPEPAGTVAGLATAGGAAVLGQRLVLIQDLDRFLDDADAAALAGLLRQLAR